MSNNKPVKCGVWSPYIESINGLLSDAYQFYYSTYINISLYSNIRIILFNYSCPIFTVRNFFNILQIVCRVYRYLFIQCSLFFSARTFVARCLSYIPFLLYLTTHFRDRGPVALFYSASNFLSQKSYSNPKSSNPVCNLKLLILYITQFFCI